MIKYQADDGTQARLPIQVKEVVHRDVSNPKYTDMSYKMLWAQIKDKLQVQTSTVLTYMHPYWGNELFPINNDKTLEIATEVLHTKEQQSIFFVLMDTKDFLEDGDEGEDGDEDEDEEEDIQMGSDDSDGDMTDISFDMEYMDKV